MRTPSAHAPRLARVQLLHGDCSAIGHETFTELSLELRSLSLTHIGALTHIAEHSDRASAPNR